MVYLLLQYWKLALKEKKEVAIWTVIVVVPNYAVTRPSHFCEHRHTMEGPLGLNRHSVAAIFIQTYL